MHSKRTRTRLGAALATIILTATAGLVSVDPAPAAAVSTDIVGPPGSEAFGTDVLVLKHGNFVVTDPRFDSAAASDVGAVYLYDGRTNALISTTTGSNFGDQVGSDGVMEVGDGNFIIRSSAWHRNLLDLADGAVTWVNGTTGLNGVVSATNSLTGSHPDDRVGANAMALSNGNYVVMSPSWKNDTAANAGAVTWGNGNSGVVGNVSAANSLVGSSANDSVGSAGARDLANGNYVVSSPLWSRGALAKAGAVTWGSGTTSTVGVVSDQNSLVGRFASDQVKTGLVLTNGNYLTRSNFNVPGAAGAGAATWGNGTTGSRGIVTGANSLIGSRAMDGVGERLVALANGNYVVGSPQWDGPAADVGAVTWGNGATGTSGVVSATNSLTGSTAGDIIGFGGIVELSNGNYVVNSPKWDNVAIADVGAATWRPGISASPSAVTGANSLIGTTAHDQVGGSTTALTNGNYVVRSPNWFRGSISVGAATWGNGTSGTIGAVSEMNSLVGRETDDAVSSGGVVALRNGNYVVVSPRWGFFSSPWLRQLGAVTWGNGSTGTVGVVGYANSLTGRQNRDEVGSNGVRALANGNYVVVSDNWNSPSATRVGAITWGNGASGLIGPVGPANSLVGSTDYEMVRGLTVLSDGNYVVYSPGWQSSPGHVDGAVWFVSGTTGDIGSRLSGLHASATHIAPSVFGGFVAVSNEWRNDAGVNVGAATYGPSGGFEGTVSSSNSAIGTPPGMVKYVTNRLTAGSKLLVATTQNRVLVISLGRSAAMTNASTGTGAVDGG
jgi:Repeat of unknown function (DUF5650)